MYGLSKRFEWSVLSIYSNITITIKMLKHIHINTIYQLSKITGRLMVTCKIHNHWPCQDVSYIANFISTFQQKQTILKFTCESPMVISSYSSWFTTPTDKICMYLHDLNNNANNCFKLHVHYYKDIFYIFNYWFGAWWTCTPSLA